MKDFLRYLNKNHVIAIVLQILLCTGIYLLRENTVLPAQAVAYVNLTAGCVLVILLYQGARKRIFRWTYVLCLLTAMFVFNRFYDETAFAETFHVALHHFLLAAGAIVGVVIAYPYLRRVAQALSAALGRWAQRAAEEEVLRRAELAQKEQRRAQTGGPRAPVPSYRGAPQKTHADGSRQENERGPNAAQGEQTVDTQGQGHELTPFDQAGDPHPLFVLIVFILLLALAGLMIFAGYSAQGSALFEKLTSVNLLTAIFSVAAFFLMMVFCAGLIVALIIEWSRILSDIFHSRRTGGWYFLYAFGLFLISWFIYNRFSLDMDNVLDILVDGKLFTPPLLFSVLVPIFLIFTENIISFIRKPHEALQQYGVQILKIAEQIVQSLLNFIQFVTGDYLTTIIELTEEDEDSDTGETPLANKGTEPTTGESEEKNDDAK